MPKKLSAASSRIATAKVNVACTIIGDNELISIYFKSICTSLAPEDLADSTHSHSFPVRTQPLTTLAI